MRLWAADASAGPDGRAHYRPTAAQISFARARDRRCQAPGCRVPAHRCEIDHRIPWHLGGPTFIDNLYCLCKRHHRAKDEAGYTYRRGPQGIEWTSPYGHHYLKRRPIKPPGRSRLATTVRYSLYHTDVNVVLARKGYRHSAVVSPRRH
jgi:hypothetical protein